MQLRVTPLRVTRNVALGLSAGCRRPKTAVAEGVWVVGRGWSCESIRDLKLVPSTAGIDSVVQ